MNSPSTIIITGGAQGIGKITSLMLEKSGYKVFVLDNDTDALNEFYAEFQRKNIYLHLCDISNEKQVQESVGMVIEKYGNIYGLINNAAISVNKPIQELSLDEWNRVISVNLTGAFLCAKHTSYYLKKTNGRIINIASTRAFMSEKNTEAYSATKGGIISLTHSLAVSLGPQISVNSISPGWIEVTHLKKKSVAHEIKLTDKDHSQHPSGRVGKAEDIAQMILFLLAPENSFITSQNFIIDGGMTKKMIYC